MDDLERAALEQTRESGPGDAEFFVGYLPIPPRTRRFAIIAAVLLSALALGAGAGAVITTGAHARGVEPFVSGEPHVGLLTIAPEPVLWMDDATVTGGVRGVLLAGGGKHGIPSQLRALDGHIVRLNGLRLSRDGHWMLEVYQGEDAPGALSPELEARLRERPSESLGEVTLSGEIVDAKCHLGRMRPGTGRTHRACAQYCVAGGIPALLVTRAADGTETPYLLGGPDRESIRDRVLTYLAEPVRVTGRVTREGDLLILSTDPATEVHRR